MPETEPVLVRFEAETTDLETGARIARTAMRDLGDETDKSERKFKLFSDRGLNLLTTLLAVRGAIGITADVLKSFGANAEQVEKITGALSFALNVGIAALAVYKAAVLAKAAAEFIAAKASILHGIGIAGIVIPVLGFAIAAGLAAAAWFAITSLAPPHAQFGGIVPPRPGGTSVIIGEAGEPEAIIPLHRAGDFGFGNGITINGPLIGKIETSDPDHLMRVLGRRIDQLKTAGM